MERLMRAYARPPRLSAPFLLGGVITLAILVAACRRAPEVPVATGDCWNLLDPNNSAPANDNGAELRLFRAKAWSDNLDPGVARWVGGSRHENGPPSGVFHGLKTRERGCVHFRRGTDGRLDAHFLNASTATLPKFPGALKCDHETDHPADITPKWLPDPGNCRRLEATLEVQQGVVVAVVDGTPTATIAQMQAALQDSLVNRGWFTDPAKGLVDQLLLEGPWYPCDPRGCCRAW
jgi:hypothetical protein